MSHLVMLGNHAEEVEGAHRTLLLIDDLNTLISAHTPASIEYPYNTTRTNKQGKISAADLLANEVAILRGEVVDLVTHHPICRRRLKVRSLRRCLRLRRVLLSLDHKEISSTGSKHWQHQQHLLVSSLPPCSVCSSAKGF